MFIYIFIFIYLSAGASSSNKITENQKNGNRNKNLFRYAACVLGKFFKFFSCIFMFFLDTGFAQKLSLPLKSFVCTCALG